MTNTIAVWLGILVLAVVAADQFIFQWDLHIFAGQQLARVTEYLAFWH